MILQNGYFDFDNFDDEDLIHVTDQDLEEIIELAGRIERAAIKERDLRKQAAE